MRGKWNFDIEKPLVFPQDLNVVTRGITHFKDSILIIHVYIVLSDIIFRVHFTGWCLSQLNKTEGNYFLVPFNHDWEKVN